MKTIITFVLFFLSFNLFATAQSPDYLVYKGKKHMLHSNPLEEYFKEYPERKPKTTMRSSALWRGYIATFEVKDKKIVLNDIKIRVDFEKWKSVKNKVVDDYYKNEDEDEIEDKVEVKVTWYQEFINHLTRKDLVIDWFTGILVLPYGEEINYVHMGYGSTYENYILLEVEDGVITREKNLKAKEYELFKEVQFSQYKKTAEYKKTLKELSKHGNSKEFIDNFLRSFIIQYTSEFLDEK